MKSLAISKHKMTLRKNFALSVDFHKKFKILTIIEKMLGFYAKSESSLPLLNLILYLSNMWANYIWAVFKIKFIGNSTEKS